MNPFPGLQASICRATLLALFLVRCSCAQEAEKPREQPAQTQPAPSADQQDSAQQTDELT
jgi:hypothetical protein